MEIENLNVEHTIEFFKTIGYTWDGKVLDKGVHMDIEDLNIELAIEFLKTIGYTWDRKVSDRNIDTIRGFFAPVEIKLINSENKEEIKAITFYDESTGENEPYCAFYKKVGVISYIVEEDFTKEWTEFLKNKGFTF